MITKRATAFCTIVLLVGLLMSSAVGCTRGKKEVPTPTVAVALATFTATPSGPTSTTVLTPQAPPTSLTPASGPTTIVALAPTATPAGPTSVWPTATPVPGQFQYTVQWGDTLYALARRYNTTVEAIVALNALPNANFIRVGQVLSIPGSAPSPGAGTVYTVQPGDTLYSLARRYGTTVEAIQQANGIVNPWYIRVGQQLTIPQGSVSPPASSGTYVVQRGDTLYGIAARFGKSVWDIVVANNLSDPSLIYVGQVLTIP